jgi:hypothetical protein
MDATYNFRLRFAQRTESKAETTNRLLMRQTLQKISTGMSLISLSLGFSIFGMLIIVNRHQADLDGLCGGSSVATVGGIGAILVGTAFLVAACLHCRFCADVLLRCRSGASLPAESVPLLKLQMYRF